MRSQLDIFGGEGGARKSAAVLPEGFQYKPELISPADEAALLARVRELPFQDFEFHGYTGKRPVVSFGWHYDFSARHLRKAEDISDFLLALRPPPPSSPVLSRRSCSTCSSRSTAPARE
jgi:hypothetical protein